MAEEASSTIRVGEGVAKGRTGRENILGTQAGSICLPTIYVRTITASSFVYEGKISSRA